MKLNDHKADLYVRKMTVQMNAETCAKGMMPLVGTTTKSPIKQGTGRGGKGNINCFKIEVNECRLNPVTGKFSYRLVEWPILLCEVIDLKPEEFLKKAMDKGSHNKTTRLPIGA